MLSTCTRFFFRIQFIHCKISTVAQVNNYITSQSCNTFLEVKIVYCVECLSLRILSSTSKFRLTLILDMQLSASKGAMKGILGYTEDDVVSLWLTILF